MKQHYIDESTGISYTLQGDYYLPNFILPVEENKFIGIWGQRHARYLKQYHKVHYYNLLTSGGKGDHLLSAAIILIVIFIVSPIRYNVQLSRIHIHCHIISHSN